jgi:hypothetical protein
VGELYFQDGVEDLVGKNWNLFSFMKFFILHSYCSVGSITKELPLSAFAVVTLFLLSLDWIDFAVWISRCVCLLWV